MCMSSFPGAVILIQAISIALGEEDIFVFVTKRKEYPGSGTVNKRLVEDQTLAPPESFRNNYEMEIILNKIVPHKILVNSHQRRKLCIGTLAIHCALQSLSKEDFPSDANFPSCPQ